MFPERFMELDEALWDAYCSSNAEHGTHIKGPRYPQCDITGQEIMLGYSAQHYTFVNLYVVLCF